MAAMLVKLTLLILSIGLALWNYFLRESLSLPFFSTLSPMLVYIIAGAILILEIFINFKTRNR